MWQQAWRVSFACAQVVIGAKLINEFLLCTTAVRSNHLSLHIHGTVLMAESLKCKVLCAVRGPQHDSYNQSNGVWNVLFGEQDCSLSRRIRGRCAVILFVLLQCFSATKPQFSRHPRPLLHMVVLQYVL